MGRQGGTPESHTEHAVQNLVKLTEFKPNREDCWVVPLALFLLHPLLASKNRPRQFELALGRRHGLVGSNWTFLLALPFVGQRRLEVKKVVVESLHLSGRGVTCWPMMSTW